MPDEKEIRKAIREATYAGDVNAVRSLLLKHSDLLHYNNYGVGTWLHSSATKPNIEMVNLLIDLGIDVNVETINTSRTTPLWSALSNDNPAIVKALLERGADVHKGRPCVAAVTGQKKHSLEMIKLLEEYGADIHKVFPFAGDSKINALSAAMTWGQKDVVEYLKSKGAVLPDEEPRKPAESQSIEDEVVAYFQKHFGPVQPQAVIEIVPTEPRIVVNCIPAAPERNYITLFTTGMSDEPMTVPKGGEDYQYGEIFIQLPADWNYQNFDNSNDGWPVEWLRRNAQYPHVEKTWLGGPVALVANDDPPQPLAPNTKFTTLLLMAEKSFTASDGRKIALYRMSPLYSEERELEIREGLPALMRALDRASVPFIVDLNRPNVAAPPSRR